MHSWQNFRTEKLLEMGRSCHAVLDFGRTLSTKELEFFSETHYVVCDYDSAMKPDIVADICQLDVIEDQSYDGVICNSVLEHVYNPFIAVEEIVRILQKEGRFFGYMPFLHPYHAKPGHYEDYYRFTESGIKYLLKEFPHIVTAPVRGNVTSLAHQLPGRLKELKKLLYWADKFFSYKQVSGYYVYAQK